VISSDHLIDRHLYVRGKIRLGYDDLMKHFVFGCCIRRGTVSETDGESEGGGARSSRLISTAMGTARSIMWGLERLPSRLRSIERGAVRYLSRQMIRLKRIYNF
jgi:hypothetical protein